MHHESQLVSNFINLSDPSEKIETIDLTLSDDDDFNMLAHHHLAPLVLPAEESYTVATVAIDAGCRFPVVACDISCTGINSSSTPPTFDQNGCFFDDLSCLSTRTPSSAYVVGSNTSSWRNHTQTTPEKTRERTRIKEEGGDDITDVYSINFDISEGQYGVNEGQYGVNGAKSSQKHHNKEKKINAKNDRTPSKHIQRKETGSIKKKRPKKRHMSRRRGCDLQSQRPMSSDSDFDEETMSPNKPSYVHRHTRSPQGKPAAMLSLSEPKFTNPQSSSDSDLPSTPFLYHTKREGSPSPKGEKQPIKRKDDNSCLRTPVKKTKLSQSCAVPLRDSLCKISSTDLMRRHTMEKSTLKNIPKSLLTLSAFPNSEEEFEPCDKQVMRTLSKQNMHYGTLPDKTMGPGLSRSYRKKDRFAGVAIHIQVQDSQCFIRNSETTSDGKNLKSQAKVPESSNILPFCQRQRDLVEAVKEEEFHDDAIIFIRDFTTLHRGAPEEYMMYLLKDIMLADGMETATVLNAYGALMHIQRIHPNSATSLNLDWDLVSSVVKKLILETNRADSPCLAHVLVFQFIVVTFIEDFQVMQKSNTPRKSYSHNLLSTDKCFGHVRNLIDWICKIITNKFKKKIQLPTPQTPKKQDQAEDRNVFKFFQELTELSQATSPQIMGSHGIESSQILRSGNYYTVLRLLQKLLQLSFADGTNASAMKIAEEFLYPYLHIPSLDQRKLCLQMLTCDPVRVKVIELLLENLWDPSTREEQQGVLTVRKIVECHFCSRPMRVSEFVEADADACGSRSRTIREQRREECEELAMLLLFLLQSYIRTKTAKYHPTSSQDVQLSQNAVNGQVSEKPAVDHWLSTDDRECLCQMGDHVEELEGHLRCHCDRLTPRTRLYLAQIECMRDMAC